MGKTSKIDNTLVIPEYSSQIVAMDDINKYLCLKEYTNYEIVVERKNKTNIEFYHENPNINNKRANSYTEFYSILSFVYVNYLAEHNKTHEYI